MAIWQISAWKLLIAGGPIIAPIFLCSVFAFYIIIERMMYLALIPTDTRHLKQTIFEQIKANNIKEAINLCDTNPSPLSKILKAGIIKFGAPRQEIKEYMEDASLFETPKLERNLNALATIAHTAPLLGLLGTVIGIAGTFHAIQIQNDSLSPVTLGSLAGGIWEALITTVAGLIVAIPAYIAYNYLVSRINRVILDMERGSSELVNLLCEISELQHVKKGDHRVEI